MKYGKIFIILQTIFFLASHAVAATIYVPSDQPTIQAGIDAAVNGDIVLVADGTYTGAGNRSIDFKGKRITLKSENGPDHTLIDCEGIERGFNFHTHENFLAMLEGFTITGGYTYTGTGIYCNSSSPTIIDCRISENTAVRDGGGIMCDNHSNPDIVNCLIKANKARGTGGGIYCNMSSPTIINCTISWNTAEHDGGGISCSYASPTITDCTITGNRAAWYGGGINSSLSSSPALDNCRILENIADLQGGGIQSSSPISITNCLIAGNRTDSKGGGIYLSSSHSPIISDCTISENTARHYGGGLYFTNSTDVNISNCTISRNTAYLHGGIYASYNSGFKVTDCILWEDLPDEIYLFSGDLTVTYSDIQGGWSGEGNIDADPLFVMEDWWDYRLLWGSPCIDTGKPGLLDADGTRRDIGAHFFDQSRELVLYLSPEARTIIRGEPGSILYTVCNSHEEAISFTGVAVLTLPGGKPWTGNPLAGPIYKTVSSESNLQMEATFEVPETWPEGLSGFTAGIGANGEIYDRDNFECMVTGP